MSISKSNLSANYDGFSLVSGGLIYSVTTFFQKSKDPQKNRRKRALIFAVITWLPLFLLVLISASFSAENGFLSFINDFETHLRFLFAIPFLILIEQMVDKAFIDYTKTSEKLIVEGQQKALFKLIQTIDKLSNLYLPEIVILVSIYVLVFLRWNDPTLFDSGKNYLVDLQNGSFKPAGIYYLFISFPIFQLLLFRWLWRWVIWIYSIFKISRFKFHVEAANIDKVAGLTYLNLVPLQFSFIFFALSVVLASDLGYDIVNEGATLQSYIIDILFFVICVPIVLYAPLLLFSPLMVKTKSAAIHQMGSLVARHNHNYMNKWVYGPVTPKEPLLGSVDNSSLSDINGGFDPVINMKIIPVNFKMFLLSCIVLLAPFVPLVFTYYSFMDLFRMILKSAFG
jgi:hypothetical protein